MPRPVKENKPEVKRVQMDMPPKSLQRLKDLQDVTEASSYTEVVRNALRLYEVLIKEHQAGAELLIKRGEMVVPLHIFAG